MRNARYEKSPGNWISVSTDQYDPDVHGKDLRCGDALCDAKVHFRVTSAAYGSSTDTLKQFYSADRSQHREDCTLLPAYSMKRNSVNLDDVINEKYHVMLNLNWNLGHPHDGLLGHQSSIDAGDTIYNRWRAQYKHATLNAQSIGAYFDTIAKLKALDETLLERLRLGHCQDLRHFSTFLIGDDKAKLNQLFDDMARGDGPLIVGFPRQLTAFPSKNELKDRVSSGDVINTNSVTLKENSTSRLIMINRLELEDPSMRPEIMAYDRNDIIAVPLLVKAEADNARRNFIRGASVSFVVLKWQIMSRDQYRPAQGAKHFRPQPDLFDGADENNTSPAARL